jgi:hypothetical protein
VFISENGPILCINPLHVRLSHKSSSSVDMSKEGEGMNGTPTIQVTSNSGPYLRVENILDREKQSKPVSTPNTFG